MTESESHASGCGKHYAVAVGRMAVDPRLIHTHTQRRALKRTPATPADDRLRSDGIRLHIVVDHHQVGIIALADEAAALDAEQRGRIVVAIFSTTCSSERTPPSTAQA